MLGSLIMQGHGLSAKLVLCSMLPVPVNFSELVALANQYQKMYKHLV